MVLCKLSMPSTKATERHDKGTTGRNFCELHEPLPRETTGFTISEASDVLPNLSYGQTLLCPGPDGHWRRHPETLPQLAKRLITMGVIVLFPSLQPQSLDCLLLLRPVGGMGPSISPSRSVPSHPIFRKDLPLPFSIATASLYFR